MTRLYDKIIVTTLIEHGGFDDKQNYYLHNYQITISNSSDFSFQLLRRKWEISDGLSWKRIVEGDGVVGEQPIIHPGQSHSYASFCPMPSTAGYMSGEFYCVDLEKNEEFTLIVPQMNFVAAELLN